MCHMLLIFVDGPSRSRESLETVAHLKISCNSLEQLSAEKRFSKILKTTFEFENFKEKILSASTKARSEDRLRYNLRTILDYLQDSDECQW